MASSRRSADLTVRYQRAYRELMARVDRFVAARWATFDGLDDATIDRFVASTAPMVVAGQVRAATLTDAYLASYLSVETGRPVLPAGVVAAVVTGAAVRNGAPPTDVYRRPYITARAATARGRSYQQARDEGLSRLRATATMDIALAARATSKAVLAGNSDTPRFVRALSGVENCAICTAAAGRPVRSNKLLALHPGCDCTSEPVVSGTTPLSAPAAPKPTDDPAITAKVTDPDVSDSSLYRVVEHQELGPLLWQAGQHFSELR